VVNYLNPLANPALFDAEDEFSPDSLELHRRPLSLNWASDVTK
jgi:hypothetical protein